jgi:hypothetical protein
MDVLDRQQKHPSTKVKTLKTKTIMKLNLIPFAAIVLLVFTQSCTIAFPEMMMMMMIALAELQQEERLLEQELQQEERLLEERLLEQELQQEELQQGEQLLEVQ